MAVLAVPWPPDPIDTERLRLRRTEARDRSGYVELRRSADVRRYLGGAVADDEAERATPDVPGDYAGVFAVETAGEFIGTVTLERRARVRPGHVRAHGDEVEVSYALLPAYWGNGYASEAVAAVLRWLDEVLPGEPVVVCTQVSNGASVRLATRLGFVEVDRFVEFDAEQWFGVRTAAPAASLIPAHRPSESR